MARDDRFYAFIIAHTPRPSSRIRRFCVNKRSLRLLAFCVTVLICASVYGFYGLTQQAAHLRTEFENQRLRAENERQRRELNNLNHRVEAVEDTSRKLAEKSGVVEDSPVASLEAAGRRYRLIARVWLPSKARWPNSKRTCRLTKLSSGNAATHLPFGPLMGNLKADSEDAAILLVVDLMSSILARISKQQWALPWFRGPAEQSLLSVGKMATASWWSWITAVA